MLDFSKSIILTGLDAIVEMLHVLLKITITALFTFTEDGETLSTPGAPTLLVDVEFKHFD